tara:strand:- start:43 stop:3339 length:3297 start_codon:yes stop_codon:yes gene_type:complete
MADKITIKAPSQELLKLGPGDLPTGITGESVTEAGEKIIGAPGEGAGLAVPVKPVRQQEGFTEKGGIPSEIANTFRGFNEMITPFFDVPVNYLAEALEAAGVIEPNEDPRDYLNRVVNAEDYEQMVSLIPHVINYGVGKRGSPSYDEYSDRVARTAGQFFGATVPFSGILAKAGQLRSQANKLGENFVDYAKTKTTFGIPNTERYKGSVRQALVDPYAKTPGKAAKYDVLGTGLFGTGYGLVKETGAPEELALAAGLASVSPLAAWGAGGSIVNYIKSGGVFGKAARKYDDLVTSDSKYVPESLKRNPETGTRTDKIKDEFAGEVTKSLESEQSLKNVKRAEELEIAVYDTTGEKVTFSPAEQTLDVPLIGTQARIEKTAPADFTRKNIERKYKVIDAIEQYGNRKFQSPIDDGPLFIYESITGKYTPLISRIDDQTDEVVFNINKLSDPEKGAFPKITDEAGTGDVIRKRIKEYADSIREQANAFASGKGYNNSKPLITTDLNKIDNIADMKSTTTKIETTLKSILDDDSLTQIHPLIKKFLDKKTPTVSFQDYKMFRMEVNDALSKSYNFGITNDIKQLSVFKKELDNMANKFGKTNKDFETFNEWYSQNVIPLESPAIYKVLDTDVSGLGGVTQYKLPKEKVAVSFLKDTNSMKTYRDFFNTQEDGTIMQKVVYDQIHRNAYDSRKAILNADKLNTYLNKNKDVLELVPSYKGFNNFYEELTNPKNAANNLPEGTVSLLQGLVTRQGDLQNRKRLINTNLLYKQVANKFDELEPQKLLQEAIKNPKLLKELKQRLKIEGTGENSVIPGVSQNDLKTTFNANVTSELLKGQQPLSNPTKFLKYLDDNQKLLTSAVGKDHYDDLKIIGESYERILVTGGVEGKAGATLIPKGLLDELADNIGTSLPSIQARIISAAEGRISPRTAGAYIVTRFINAGQTARAEAVFRDAMFDPALAKELAKKIEPNKIKGGFITELGQGYSPVKLNYYFYNSGYDYLGGDIFGDKGQKEIIPLKPPSDKDLPPRQTIEEFRPPTKDPTPIEQPILKPDAFKSSAITPPPTPTGIDTIDVASLFPNDATATAIAKRRTPQAGIGTLPT